EVAVVGASDERLGERVVAVVVGTATEEELERHCLASDDLARFKRPREYRFVEELPKSPSGKILRRVLREAGVTAGESATGFPANATATAPRSRSTSPRS